MRCRPNQPIQQTPAQDVKGHVVEAVTTSFFPNADLVANFDSATGSGGVEVTYKIENPPKSGQYTAVRFCEMSLERVPLAEDR
jgi:hypothetical protein